MDEQIRRTNKLTLDADKTEAKILELVGETEDAKDKGFLLILLKINSSLAENTRVVNDVAERLEEHMETFKAYSTEERSMRDESNGSKKVWGYVATALKTALIGLIAYFQSQMITLHADVIEIKLHATKIQMQLEQHIQNHPQIKDK